MYTQQQIEEIIKQILYSEKFVGDIAFQIKNDTNMVTDLGLDSLDLTEIICMFEKRTNLLIANSDIDKILGSAWSFENFCHTLQRISATYATYTPYRSDYKTFFPTKIKKFFNREK